MGSGITSPNNNQTSFILYRYSRILMNKMQMQANYQPIMIQTLLENLETEHSKEVILLITLEN